MALPIYLTMTAWEFSHREVPPHCGYMACHFSPYSSGLSNIPNYLPEGALLTVNDRIPPADHDPACIARQLKQAVDSLKPCGVLLDFQRPEEERTRSIVQALCQCLPCPVAVPPDYARDSKQAVFLPPVPLNQKLSAYLQPWRDREIWLEVDCSGLTMTLTETGCQTAQDPVILEPPVFTDPELHCHYSIRTEENRAVFSLSRDKEDLLSLTEEAQELGVTLAAGLYQELSNVLFVHGSA